MNVLQHWAIALQHCAIALRHCVNAIPQEAYEGFFTRQLPQLSIQEYQLKLIIFNPESEVIIQWKN